MNILEWAPRSLRGVNIGICKYLLNKSRVGSEHFNGSISLHFHNIFDYMLYTVVSSTAAYPEYWKRLVVSDNSNIWVMLYQEYDPELYDKWLIYHEYLTRYIKSGEKIVERVKVIETPFSQGDQF